MLAGDGSQSGRGSAVSIYKPLKWFVKRVISLPMRG